MKVYEGYSEAHGFNTDSRLELGGDGRFSYKESWKDYTSVALYGGAEGRWRRDGGAVIFNTESADRTLPHPWVAGEESRAVERGDTLVFPDGFTLRVPPERKEDVPIHNTGRKPLAVVLEPWGTRHEVTPGERVRVVARGPGGMGGLEIVRGEDEIVVYGWSGSQVGLVREPKPAAPPPPPPPRAAPPVAPGAPKRLPFTPYPRFKLPTPTPELAALIRRRVEEVPALERPGWLVRLCKLHGALPLHSTQFDLWVLRPDGYVLCIDHDSAADKWPEPETDPERAYAVVAQGARTYPELGELLSTAPAGFRQCEDCGGVGWIKAPPPSEDTADCSRCSGFGSYVPRAPADLNPA